MSLLPPPHTLGLPKKFQKWRNYQEQAILDLSASPHRFNALVATTGMGKSAVYITYSILTTLEDGGRVLVLTKTKSLQTQLEEDFRSIRALDVRGKSNYDCIAEPGLKVDEGPCQSGYICALKEDGCLYFDRLRRARRSRIVVTNYSFWLSSYMRGPGVGNFDLMIIDEAHECPNELSKYLSVSITNSESRNLLRLDLPDENNWWDWIENAAKVVDLELALPSFPDRPVDDTDIHSHQDYQDTSKRYVDRLRKLKKLGKDIQTIRGLGPKLWTVEKSRWGKGSSFRWDLTDPAPLAERYLFRGIPKIIFSSATVREKTLDLLGVKNSELELLEYPSAFKKENRPIYLVNNSPRMNFRTGEEDKVRWLEIIDSILESRLDRRGIIHTVSFDRANYVMKNSRFSKHMISHDSGSESLQSAVGEYLSRKPAILVSPSVTTGIDLPGSACEYVIVSKIPFPDARSKILKARSEADPDYQFYMAAQVMVQSTGRHVRSEDDRGESFLVDGNLRWFIPRYYKFIPRWWRDATRRVDRIPKPPRPLPESSNIPRTVIEEE